MVVHGSRQGYFPDTELRVIDRSWGSQQRGNSDTGPSRAETTGT